MSVPFLLSTSLSTPEVAFVIVKHTFRLMQGSFGCAKIGRKKKGRAASMKNRSLSLPTDLRVTEAFWRLAQDANINHITVKMITDEAGCSRGTFYYHFEDVAALASVAIENEVIVSGNLPRAIHSTLSLDPNGLGLVDGDDVHTQRIYLALKQGSPTIVEKAIAEAAIRTWRFLLCRKGEDFTDEALFYLRFFMSGMRYVVESKINRADIGGNPHISMEYMREVMLLSVRRVCEAQGTSEGEFRERLEQLEKAGWILLAE